MSDEEKKQQRIYDLFISETKSKFLWLPYRKPGKPFFFFLQKKSFLRKRWGGVLNKKRKEGF